MAEFYDFHCPHCQRQVQIMPNELNCKIFRCGTFKHNGEMLNPHLPKEECDRLISEESWFLFYRLRDEIKRREEQQINMDTEKQECMKTMWQCLFLNLNLNFNSFALRQLIMEYCWDAPDIQGFFSFYFLPMMKYEWVHMIDGCGKPFQVEVTDEVSKTCIVKICDYI